MTPCGLPTIAVRFLFRPDYHKKNRDRSIIAGYPYGARMMPYDVSTVYDFKICNSADYYKIVEATEIVGSRRIVGTS